MRILHITPAFQHPRVRGPHRHYHFLRELSQRHAITLLTLARSDIPAEALQEMASYTERLLTFSVSGASSGHARGRVRSLPFIGGRLEQSLRLREGVRQMKAAFTRLVREEAYDVVLFHGKSVFPVIEDWDDLPIVIDFCDATSMRIRAEMRYAGLAAVPLKGLRYAQVRRLEKRLVGKTPHIAFISPRDREAVLGSADRSAILPNGVDLQYWTRKSHNPRPNCLIFSGVMDYAPNEDAAVYLIDRILPLLRPSVSNLEVFIVGRDPSAALLDKARRYPDVTVTGFVDDMRPYLERAAVCAAPLRYASGMQNKVLEAMAMQVPVVTTSIVASGLCVDGAQPPVHVADGAREFAERIVNLLARETERSRLAADGRRFIERHFIWSRSAEKLEKMCLDAVQINGQRQQGSKAVLTA